MTQEEGSSNLSINDNIDKTVHPNKLNGIPLNRGNKNILSQCAIKRFVVEDKMSVVVDINLSNNGVVANSEI